MAGSSMAGAAYGASAMMDIGGAFAQQSALEMQGEYTKSIDDINAQFAGVEAKDAISRGETNARLLRQKARTQIGAQRSSFAGQGVDVNTGSAADVQKDTAALSALDAQTIRNNAFREALGFKVQALNLQYAGDFAKMSGDNQGFQTLLTGGGKAVGDAGMSGYYLSQGS